jgi:hypothetical protein
MEIVDDLKMSENSVLEGYSENHNWTLICLWELPYAKALISCTKSETFEKAS